MNDAVKISMVSYINSKPFQLGMELTGLIDEVELHLEVPAITASKLMHSEVDIALVPVAVLPKLEDLQLITDFCIGANQHVDSVLLLSQVPIHEIETVYLDAHSRTSANLIQVLFREYWRHDVNYVTNTNVHHNLVQGRNACLMIGDKALIAKNDYPYVYDLASFWFEMTKLPFVFAVWVTNKEGIALEGRLNEAFKLGIENLHQVASLYQSNYPNVDVHSYLSESIDFHFNQEKAKALDLFLQKCKQNIEVAG